MKFNHPYLLKQPSRDLILFIINKLGRRLWEEDVVKIHSMCVGETVKKIIKYWVKIIMPDFPEKITFVAK